MCRIAGVADHLDAARAAAEAVLSSPSSMPLWTHGSGAGLGLIAVLGADAKMAEEQYFALQSSPAMMEISFVISSDRLLGLLSQTIGNLEQATVHFEDALAFCRKAGYRPELAWTCCDYADTLLQRSDEGDREKAMSLLDESLAISSELGMRPLMERVLSRREILEA